MNGIGSSITRIPIALYTATHMCALMLTPAQIDVQMADDTFCKTSVVIKNYQSSEIFSRGLSESRRRALLVYITRNMVESYVAIKVDHITLIVLFLTHNHIGLFL